MRRHHKYFPFLLHFTRVNRQIKHHIFVSKLKGFRISAVCLIDDDDEVPISGYEILASEWNLTASRDRQTSSGQRENRHAGGDPRRWSPISDFSEPLTYEANAR